LFLPLSAPAQTPIPADIKKAAEARFKNKVLPLRHVADARSVKYDEAGKFVGTPKLGDWTLHSHLEITKVEFKKGELTIEGNRIALSFEDWERQKTPKYIRTSDRLEIQIAPKQGEPFSLEEELTKAFLAPTEDFPENLPDYWQRFLCKMKGITEQCPVMPFDEREPLVREGVTEPRLIRQRPPSFSPLARAARLTGNIGVVLVVDQNGRVTIYEVLKPLGLGLEEEAIKAMKEWLFEPARRDGGIAASYISVNINFALRN
jgi:TonB family protein